MSLRANIVIYGECVTEVCEAERNWCRKSSQLIGQQQETCLTGPQSRSQSFVPLDQRSENESSGSIHFEITMEITEFCISGFTAHGCAVRSLDVWYLCRMPEMDAPRALVFRLLVKGNEALGTRLTGPLVYKYRVIFVLVWVLFVLYDVQLDNEVISYTEEVDVCLQNMLM